MSEQSAPPGYILGEMAATVKSIDSNVQAMRTELGDITRRLGDVEKNMASMQAERTAQQPEYQTFLKNVRQHMSDINEWRSRVQGNVETARGGGRILQLALTALFTLALFIAGQVWTDRRSAILPSPAPVSAPAPTHAIESPSPNVTP